MHHFVIVIGHAPEQLSAAEQHYRFDGPYAPVVAGGIGGSGRRLLLLPGATSGRLVIRKPGAGAVDLPAAGLAMPGMAEAAQAAASVLEWAAAPSGMADAAEAGDVDIDALDWPPGAVIEADGTAHDWPQGTIGTEWMEQVRAWLRAADPWEPVAVVDVHDG
jgi:hypothetical protein